MKSHAGFDVDKLSTLTALTEEAAASVAEALHYRMSNFSLPSNWVVQKAAAVVADGLLREYQAGNTPSLPSIPAPSIFFDASSRRAVGVIQGGQDDKYRPVPAKGQ